MTVNNCCTDIESGFHENKPKFIKNEQSSSKSCSNVIILDQIVLDKCQFRPLTLPSSFGGVVVLKNHHKPLSVQPQFEQAPYLPSSSSSSTNVIHLNPKQKPHKYNYDEITKVCIGYNEAERIAALEFLATDPELDKMLLRMFAFIAKNVEVNLKRKNVALLFYLMRMVQALLGNPMLHLKKYVSNECFE